MALETMREKQINVRVGPEEWERLDFVAKHYGLNPAAVIRMLVKREADQLAAAARREQVGAAEAPKTKK